MLTRLLISWRRCGLMSSVASMAGLLLALGLPTAAAGQTHSPFAWRGIIEGAYGAPWDHSERLRALGFMAAHEMNAYVHAPKLDPFGRTQWRDPYPPDQQRAFNQEIGFARSHAIDWIPDISPGVPLIPSTSTPRGTPSRDACFSCLSDRDAVLSKFAPFIASGARTFMVSFDDAQKVLTHPQDIAAFGSGDGAYAMATAAFLDRVLEALRGRVPGARLLTVAADYSGTADTAYLQAFRRVLDPAIVVLWTGDAVFSQNFDPNDARAYGRAIGRTPVVWDNWTVNDLDGSALGDPTRIYLGPYSRRPDVVGVVGGSLLNPMNLADLNLLPFATAADFLNDPQHFDARSSWLGAVRAMGGPAGDSLRAFAETSYSTHLDETTEAPTFVATADRLLGDYLAPMAEWPAAARRLDTELGLVQGAEGRLQGIGSLSPFVREAAPWLASARTAAGAGRAAALLLAAERPTLSVRSNPEGFVGHVSPPDPSAAGAARNALDTRDAAMRSDHHFTFGDRRPAIVDTPPSSLPPNTMDVFIGRVRQLDQAWVPTSLQAASEVTLSLDGRPVSVDAGGAFRLPVTSTGQLLVAHDGAGGSTAIRLASDPATTGGLTTRCLSRRTVIVHLRLHRGERLRGVRLTITGRPSVVLGARSLRGGVLILRHLPSRTVIIRVRLSLRQGSRTHARTISHTLHPCTPRRRHRRAPARR